MKIPSRRTLLFSGVLLVLVIHLVLNFLNSSPEQHGPAPGSPEAVELASREIAPSVSTLTAMGLEWQKHIDALPPTARAASQARLDQEKAFFAHVFQLSAEERDKAVQEHLAALMNDRDVQAVMAEDRLRKLAQLPESTRQSLLKSYVTYKRQVTGR
ncbi:hypothetical protein BH09VER1_BH09VER1_07160 [soil metagenome]